MHSQMYRQHWRKHHDAPNATSNRNAILPLTQYIYVLTPQNIPFPLCGAIEGGACIKPDVAQFITKLHRSLLI